MLDGYFDYNLEPEKAITDLQIGKRLKSPLYFIVEGRYNGFRDDWSLAGGLELRL